MTATRRPAVFLDRDGTLIDDPGYLADPRQVRVLPGVADALARLKAAGFARVIITNQSGIGRQRYTSADFRAVQREVERRLAAAGASIDAVYHCPHHPDDGCDCRKPGTALHRAAIAEHRLDPAASWCVGDRLGDVMAARALGAQAILVRTGEGPRHADAAAEAGFPVADDLATAVDWIMAFEDEGAMRLATKWRTGQGEHGMDRRPGILIAEDHAMVAYALKTALEEWFRVDGVVHALDEVDAAIRANNPKVVLLDVTFPEGSALTRLPALVASHPGVHFVVLTAYAERSILETAIGAGAAAFVVKHSAPTELRVAIEEALAGRTYVTPLLLVPGHPVTRMAPEPDLAAAGLSERQRWILRQVRAETTQKEMAETLGVSVKTIEYHFNVIRGRLGLSKLADLARWADRHLPPSSGEPPAGLDEEDIASAGG